MDWIRRYTHLLVCVTFLTCTLGALTVSPQIAWADSATEKKLEKALASAIEDYDILQIQDAEKKLDDALKLAKSKDVSSPVVARVHVMLGVVRFAATRDESATEEAFVDALNVDYNAKIDPVYETPELAKIFAAAKSKVSPPVAVKPGELGHNPVKTADAGKPLQFEVLVPSDLPVFKLTLVYRHYGEEDFTRLNMEPTNKNGFAVALEGSDVRTSQMDYFILAEDRDGNIVSQIGSAESPVNFVVLGSGNAKDPDKEEDPDKDPDTAEPSGHQWVYISLFGGTGAGFLPSGSPTANPETEDFSAGFAPAFAHVLLDFGVRITDAAHLGIYFRWQLAPAQDFTNINVDASGFPTTEEECLGLGLPGDCLLGLKYKWFFKSTGSIRAYSSLGTGVGRVRNWVRLKKSAQSDLCQDKEIINNPEGADFCYIRDTVRTGWFHAGIGGGIAVPLTNYLDFQADTYLMFLLPDTSISLDLAAGFSVKF